MTPEEDHAAQLKEVILADDQRRQQAGWIALCQVGPEPEHDTCLWLEWAWRWNVAAEAAFRRLN